MPSPRASCLPWQPSLQLPTQLSQPPSLLLSLQLSLQPSLQLPTPLSQPPSLLPSLPLSLQLPMQQVGAVAVASPCPLSIDCMLVPQRSSLIAGTLAISMHDVTATQLLADSANRSLVLGCA